MASRRSVPTINPIVFLAEKSNKCDQRIVEPLEKIFVSEVKSFYPFKSVKSYPTELEMGILHELKSYLSRTGNCV